MRTHTHRLLIASVLFVASQSTTMAAPSCVNTEAGNFVIATAIGDLTAPGWGGIWLLRSIDSDEFVYLRRCSNERKNKCYFATNVKPGRYYFEQAVPEGKNDLTYPVSTASLWFPIAGTGVDYIGHWTIERQGQAISKLQVGYNLGDLDDAIELCQIRGKSLYLDRLKSTSVEITD